MVPRRMTNYKSQQSLVNIFLKLCSCLFLLVMGYYYSKGIQKGLHPYTIGDYLINYHCGFVRRGLLGTVFIGISTITGVGISSILLSSAIIAYLFVFGAILYKSLKHPWLFLLLAFSPFALLFPLNDWGAMGRKEAWLLLLTVLMFWGIPKVAGIWQMPFILLGCAIGIFIHESFVFLYVPWILFLADNNAIPAKQLEQPSYKVGFLFRTYKKSVLIMGVSCVLLLTIYSLTKQNAVQKTNCLIQNIEDITHTLDPAPWSKRSFLGAVNWLDKDATTAIKATTELYTHSVPAKYWALRILILFFSLWIGISATCGTKNFLKIFRQNSLIFLAIIGGLSFQLFVAYDWGRFLHQFFFCSIIFLLFIAGQHKEVKPIKWTYSLLFFSFIILSSFVMVEHVYFGGAQEEMFMQVLGKQIIGSLSLIK